jgi:Predicted membrane protein (DUF2232)
LLFAPPVLVFGPLAGLLLLARPRALREWLWLLATAAWSALWLYQSGDLAGQFARAAAVLLTGTYLALTVWRPSPNFSRVLLASAIAGVALLLWTWNLGVGWSELQRAVERDLWSYNRELIMRWGQAAPGTASAAVLAQMSAVVRTVAAFFPALLTLAAIAGLSLAWAWHHRIARRPLGPPLPGFTAFGFSDQLVWGWVVGLALCLLPLPPGWSAAGANLLMVLAVLYAVRGLAVFAVRSRQVPIPVIATLTLVAMFLLPFVVGGLTLLGLADTWLDFRRRLSAPAT